MSVRELIDQIEIQGAYHIKLWDDDKDDYITLAKGGDFEYENWDIEDEYLEKKISYMYAIDGVLNIEVW